MGVATLLMTCIVKLHYVQVLLQQTLWYVHAGEKKSGFYELKARAVEAGGGKYTIKQYQDL